MIFQPVVPILLIAVLGLGAAAVCVWALSRARGAGRASWIMRLVLVLLLAFMALRPGIPGGTGQTLATDTDIVLVVDVTGSMAAEDAGDTAQTRFDLVRDDIAALVAAYPGARFALITFAAQAQVRMPLTTDATALLSSIEVLSPEVTAQSRGSSIGVAADTLAQTLHAAAEVSPDRARMVFYFGDGEQTADGSPESFDAAAADTSGGAVFGYGTQEGGPMRVTTGGVSGTDGGYIMYQGERALSVIDEQALRDIAGQLGVDYTHRDPGTAPEFPLAPSVARTSAGTTGAVTDLTWIFALAVIPLLLIEIALALAGLIRTRRTLRRTPRPTPGERTS